MRTSIVLLSLIVFTLPVAATTGDSTASEHPAKPTPTTSSTPSVSSPEESSIIAPHPATIYMKVWRMVYSNYVDRTFNGQDWQIWKDRCKDIHSLEDARKAIKVMLASLGDPATCLVEADHYRQLEEKKRITQEINPMLPGEIGPGQLACDSNPSDSGKALRFCKVKRDKIGYLQVRDFFDWDLIKRAGKVLEGSQDLSGLVIDLRGNPGGLQGEAASFASLFLNKGSICSILDIDGYIATKKADSEQVIPETTKLVVLIDESTANGAELAAAALRDNGRATLIGEHSRGQNKIQYFYRIDSESAVKISVSRWLTPEGESIEGKGIRPDLVVPSGKSADGKDQQLEAALDLLTRTE
ncbi:MAG: S41 family peptidase [Candidatus Obscuribacterales bacterium]